MKAIVKLSQGYRSTYFKFDDEISAIQYATITKEHVMDMKSNEGDVVYTNVSVILNPNENDIDD